MAQSTPVIIEEKECNICAEKITKRRKEVKCPKCQYVICKDCFQRYTVDHITIETVGTTCMNCKDPLDFDFISENTTKDFVNNKWRVARKEVMVGVELSKLPATQESARRYTELIDKIQLAKQVVDDTTDKIKLEMEIPEEISLEEHLEYIRKQIEIYRKNKDTYIKSAEEHTVYKKQYKKRSDIKKAMILIKNKKGDVSKLEFQLKQFVNQLTTNDEELFPHIGDREKEERRAFIMPCPYGECKGFLSTGYKCGLCSRKVCPTCHVKIEDKDTEHECEKDAVDTVKMINSDTKPCPKCGARISKVNGCDQMWCVCCKTAFSWNTGRIVAGERIHNPEYFRWMRDREITIPRVEEQIGCNVQPTIFMFHDVRRQFRSEDLCRIHDLIQKMEHFSALVVHNQVSNRDLRVAYLTNNIDKEKLKDSILKRERIAMKQRFVNNIHQTIVDVLGDTLRKMRDSPSTFGALYIESIKLCDYVNEQFSKFTKTHNMKTPQYSNKPATLFSASFAVRD